jgi:photosystem II stability/assembly factor-like uncharacterized protein
LHRTTNGGKKWSDRVLDGPWPIKSIIFVDEHNGWAAGGGGNFGGIYGSHDGGKTWAVELDAGVGPQTCTTADSHIFCAGVDNDATSHVYSREFDLDMHGDDD